MSRQSKGARLREKKRAGGETFWVINDTEDGKRVEISTGTSSRSEAEIILADYIRQKFRPSGPVTADEIKIGHVLAIDAEEHAPHVADPVRIGYAIDALDPFWGDLPASAVKKPTCRRYADYRNKAVATVQRELGTFRPPSIIVQERDIF